MKKRLLLLSVLTLMLFVIKPLQAFASLAPPANLVVKQEGTKLLLSFTPNASAVSTILIRQKGVSSETPNLPLSTSTTWETVLTGLVSPTTVELEQSTYTYLLYSTDGTSYSATKRIVVLQGDGTTISSNLSTDAFVLLSKTTTTIARGITLTINPQSTFSWFGGTLYNEGTINLKGSFEIPSGEVYQNGDGVLSVASGGKLKINGTYKIGAHLNDKLEIQNGGLVEVASTGTLRLDLSGTLDVKTEGILNVAGLVEVYSQPEKSIFNAGARITFSNGSKYYLQALNGIIPIATWGAGSTVEWAGSEVPTGINQTFSNFIWDVSGQSRGINLGCNLKVSGDLIMRSTGNNPRSMSIGSCDYTVGKNLIIGSKAIISFDAKLSVNGNIVNNGSLTVASDMTVNGSITNGAGASLQLPAKVNTLVNGNFINNGTVSAPSPMVLLDVAGRLEHNTATSFPLAQTTYVRNGGITSNGPMEANSATTLLEVTGGITHNSTGAFHLALKTDIKSGGLINKGIMKPFTSAFDELYIVGNVQNQAGAQLQFPNKTASITGDLLNAGAINSTDKGALTITGKLDVASTATATLLPLTTTVKGNLLNAGKITAQASLTVEGALVQNTGSLSLATMTTVLGDLISTGSLELHEQLFLHGSLEAPSGASFNSLAKKRELYFKQIAQDKVTNFSFTKGMAAAGSIQKVAIEAGRKVQLTSDIQLSGASTFDVASFSALYLGNHSIFTASGASGSAFTLNGDATLTIGHAGGISASGSSGAIRTDSRSFSSKAYYVYNGSVAQVTGTGLPAKVEQLLVIDNPTTVTLSQNLITSMSLNLKRGKFDLNGNKVTIEKDLRTEAGTIAGGSTSRLELLGIGTKQIPGGSISDLYVKAKDATLSLAGDLTVDRRLHVDDGVLYTNAYKIILQRNANSILGSILLEDIDALSKGFISGTIETALPTTAAGQTYDINGIGVSVKFNGKAGGTTYVTRKTGGILDKKNKIKFANRSYQIATTEVNGLNADVTFQYMADDFTDLIFDNQLKIYKTADGETFEKRTNTTVNTEAKTLTVSGVDQFNAAMSTAVSSGMRAASSTVTTLAGNRSGLGQQGGNFSGSRFGGISVVQGSVAAEPTSTTWAAGTEPAPLPVELLSFSASLTKDGDAVLSWATATETNNRHFEVQRSENGQNWSTVCLITGKGNSSQLTNYTYTDLEFSSVQAPIAYYRLKQVDFDGTHEFSKIVALELTEQSARFKSIYLNKATGNLEVRYSNLDINLPVHVVLSDIKGRTFINQQVKLDQRSGTLTIPVSASASGILVAKAASGTVFLSTKVIK